MYGPQVTVTSPTHAHVGGFDVTVTAAHAYREPAKAWAEIDGVACTSVVGPGPYTLLRQGLRHATVEVHVPT